MAATRREQGWRAPEIADLEEALFHEAFDVFVAGVRNRLPPDTRLPNASRPPFRPARPKAEWAGAFVHWAETHGRRANVDPQTIRDAAMRVLYDDVVPKDSAQLPFLEPREIPRAPRTSTAGSVTRVKLPRTDGARYTLDVESYVQERFPRALQEFIREHAAEVYLHDGTHQDALRFHLPNGFTEVYDVHPQWRREMYFLMRAPATGHVRLVVPNLRTADYVARVSSWIGASTAGVSKAYVVRHGRREKLLRIATQAATPIAAADLAFVGFQGAVLQTVTKLGSAAAWQPRVLTKGLSIQAYENHSTGARVVSAQSAYGDQMSEVLEFLYARGARRYVYLDVAGALDPAMQVGDILVPTTIGTGPAGRWIPFRNGATQLLPPSDARGRVHHGVRHDWVQTLLTEDTVYLDKQVRAGVQSLNVEAKYVGLFGEQRPDTQIAMMIVVSDTPLGAATYDRYDEAAEHVRASADRAIHAALAEIARPAARRPPGPDGDRGTAR